MTAHLSSSKGARPKSRARRSAPGVIRSKLARLTKYILLCVSVLAAVIPVYWMVTISLKSEVDQFATPPRWLQFSPTLAHYYDAFFTRSFGQYLLTSITVCLLYTSPSPRDS